MSTRTVGLLCALAVAWASGAGCSFQPDMGAGRFPCQTDAECRQFGECTCLAGWCVPERYGQYCGEAAECQVGLEPCGPDCVDLRNDPEHCGQCEKTCDQPGPAFCDGNQAVQYDPIGSCLNANCLYGESREICQGPCRDGACTEDPCQPACEPGEECIAGECWCGSNRCQPGETCYVDECYCAAVAAACSLAETCCQDGCFDLQADMAHCGDCDTDCMQLENVFDAACWAGQCEVGLCATGFGNCDLLAETGCEANLDDDPQHCRGCDGICGAGQVCVDGQCRSPSGAFGIVCGLQGINCELGSFCCLELAQQVCMGFSNPVVKCAGIELLCDDHQDCPDGDVCCLDPDRLRAGCWTGVGCPYGDLQLCAGDGECEVNLSCGTGTVGDMTFRICL